MAKNADAVVVGGAIVRRIAENASAADLPERIANFVRPLVQAARSASSPFSMTLSFTKMNGANGTSCSTTGILRLLSTPHKSRAFATAIAAWERMDCLLVETRTKRRRFSHAVL